MNNNIWGNYFQFMKPETKKSVEINSWIQESMACMDDFTEFSKKICEMKATPDDVMALWKNASKKLQNSVTDCIKMFGFSNNSESDEAAQKNIEENNKKIKNLEKEIDAKKKEIDRLSQLAADQKKETDKDKKEIDRLSQLAADQKKEIDKDKKEIARLSQAVSSLEAAAKPAAPLKPAQ